MRLCVPYGAEALCRRLRREFGVSLLLAEGDGTDALHAAFDPTDAPRGRIFLPLYDETAPLPPLRATEEIDSALPQGVCREELLSALITLGAIRAGEVTVAPRP
ncbi:MAG: hypothetical protein IKN53_06775 [Oscillibacter sp.]|nr:hypothetical protein [Oscillibacter sp.]